jgi:hypothetical protein
MARRIASVALGQAIAGCGDTTGPFDTRPSPFGPGEPAGYTTPEEVVEAHARALTYRRLDWYFALLEPWPAGRADEGFRYYPQTGDLDDFPWMAGVFWDLDEEIDMISNMFDESFVSNETGESIDSIDADIDVQKVTELSGDEVAVDAHAVMQALWSASDGLRSDVRFEFLLVRGSDGYLRIRSIQETHLFLRSDPESELSSWGAIKGLYRS